MGRHLDRSGYHGTGSALGERASSTASRSRAWGVSTRASARGAYTKKSNANASSEARAAKRQACRIALGPVSLQAGKRLQSRLGSRTRAARARSAGTGWGTSRNFRTFPPGPSGEHPVTFESFSRDLPPLIKKRDPELHLVTFERFSRDLPPLIKKLWGISFQSSKISPKLLPNIQTLTKIGTYPL